MRLELVYRQKDQTPLQLGLEQEQVLSERQELEREKELERVLELGREPEQQECGSPGKDQSRPLSAKERETLLWLL